MKIRTWGFFVVFGAVLLASSPALAKEKTWPVTFRLEHATARKVFLSGTFNDWIFTAREAMKKENGGWTKTLNLPAGVYEYKFKVEANPALPDDGWMIDPKNTLKVANQYKTENSIIVVPANYRPDTATVLAAFRRNFKDINAMLAWYVANGKIEAGKEFIGQFFGVMGAVGPELEAKMASFKPSTPDKSGKTALKRGDKPPVIATKSLSGGDISLDALKGKVVLLDFWATWCGPCVGEMPNVKRVYERFKDKGFVIVGISLDKDVSKLDRYLQMEGITWEQIYDGLAWKSPYVAAYGVDGIPATFLLGKDGLIDSMDLRGEELEKRVEELLGA